MPFKVQPQPTDQIGATPLSANYKDTVDKSFNDMVDQARASKGSVFDTMFDKALRYGTGDSFGGLSPQAMGGPAQIVNPRHWIWDMMKDVTSPETRAILEGVPQKLEFIDLPQRALSNMRAFGITQPVGGRMAAGIPRDVQVAISPKAMNLGIGEAVGEHELAGHAVPMMTQGRPFPYGEAGGMNVIMDELKNPLVQAYTPEYMGKLLGAFRGTGGPAHIGVELQANRQIGQQGFQPLIRDIRNVDPATVEANADFLRSLMQGRK